MRLKIAAIIGFLCGAICVFFMFSLVGNFSGATSTGTPLPGNYAPVMSAPPKDFGKETEALKAEITRLEEALAAAQDEAADLQEQLDAIENQRALVQSTMKNRMEQRQGERMQKELDMMSRYFQFDDAQQGQVSAFLRERNENIREQIAAAMRDQDFAGMRSLFMELHDTSALDDFLVSEVLSEDQLANWEAYATERTENELEADANRALSRMIRTYDLSEEQKDAIFNSYYLNNSFRLNSAQQEEVATEWGMNPDSQDFADALHAYQAEWENGVLQEILTPEQFKQFAQSGMRPSQPGPMLMGPPPVTPNASAADSPVVPVSEETPPTGSNPTP